MRTLKLITVIAMFAVTPAFAEEIAGDGSSDPAAGVNESLTTRDRDHDRGHHGDHDRDHRHDRDHDWYRDHRGDRDHDHDWWWMRHRRGWGWGWGWSCYARNARGQIFRAPSEGMAMRACMRTSRYCRPLGCR